MKPNLAQLRRMAAGRTLVEHEAIERAIEQLGFVQADPIRAPARAQDLILRQRVAVYRAGELERCYPSLRIDEDTLHVYGFLPQRSTALLHPRQRGNRWQQFLLEHRSVRQAVLRYLEQNPSAHPRDVEKAVQARVVMNAWGGKSSATTLMLEALHHEGAVRVSHREAGQRVYVTAPPRVFSPSPQDRAERLAQLIVQLYAPLPERSLRGTLNALRCGSRPHPREVIAPLVKQGILRRETVGADVWVWPADETEPEPNERVRLLAPFDPIVSDRRRFELLWGWEYRFEAYTPAGKRKLGYYALPLLWRDRVIGWANAERQGSSLDVRMGFAGAAPKDRAFRRELDAEIERLRAFVGQPAPG